jgi:23S rRNA (cytosine1962-C5)-methyltransferase
MTKITNISFMRLIFPTHWTEYELIDTGGFEKLERFGTYILSRPEPQAVWDKKLSMGEWEKRADAIFRLNKDLGKVTDSIERGEWKLKPGMPQQWFMAYNYKNMHLKFRLGLTSFKHVGLFPEQSENWDYIFDFLAKKKEPKKVLNLFAYTGGASLAAKYAGADVVHLDAVKQVISWSRENMIASGLDGIRWVVDDALTFMKREVKRGNFYQGIILDPPAYGRGPEGEKWVLEQQINELIYLCSKILMPENSFFVMNLYSMGLSSLIAENVILSNFGSTKMESGEIYVPDHFGCKLPLGVFLRFSR